MLYTAAIFLLALGLSRASILREVVLSQTSNQQRHYPNTNNVPQTLNFCRMIGGGCTTYCPANQGYSVVGDPMGVLCTGYGESCCRSNLQTQPQSQTSTCGRPPTLRVVGGAQTYQCEYPWMASIRVNIPSASGYLVICSGVLIDTRTVITSSSCMEHFYHIRSAYSGSSLEVVMGEHDLGITEPQSQSLTVSQVIMHPRYDPSTHANDIAILQMSRDVTLSSCINPVCLPQAGERISGQCTIAGWGHSDVSNMFARPVLLKGNVTLLDPVQCQQALGSQHIPENAICTSSMYTGAAPCPGDEGGMLVCPSSLSSNQLTLVGVVGDVNCQRGGTVLNTGVAGLLDWISAYSSPSTNTGFNNGNSGSYYDYYGLQH